MILRHINEISVLKYPVKMSLYLSIMWLVPFIFLQSCLCYTVSNNPLLHDHPSHGGEQRPNGQTDFENIFIIDVSGNRIIIYEKKEENQIKTIFDEKQKQDTQWEGIGHYQQQIRVSQNMTHDHLPEIFLSTHVLFTEHEDPHNSAKLERKYDLNVSDDVTDNVKETDQHHVVTSGNRNKTNSLNNRAIGRLSRSLLAVTESNQTSEMDSLETIKPRPEGEQFKDLADCITKKCRNYVSQKSCIGKCASNHNTPCSCHPSCMLFQRCCADFQSVCTEEYAKAASQIERYPGIQATCNPFLNHMVIAQCPQSASQAEKDKCDIARDASEFQSVIPVTDDVTAWHFKNTFCRECWNITGEKEFWRINLDAPDGQRPDNPSLSEALQLLIDHPTWATWTLRSGLPVYECPVQLDVSSKKCETMVVDHSDLAAMCDSNNTVESKQTCLGRCNATVTFPCSCQPECILHETCCADFVQSCPDHFVEARDLILQYPDLKMVCDDILRVPVISHCPASAPSKLKDQCKSRDPFSIKSILPVTDSITQWQFKNKFCWMCWQMRGEAKAWTARAVKDAIGYSPTGGSSAESLIYMLENHEFTYWFPQGNVARHACVSSPITCLMRQFYDIPPSPEQCSNTSRQGFVVVDDICWPSLPKDIGCPSCAYTFNNDCRKASHTCDNCLEAEMDNDVSEDDNTTKIPTDTGLTVDRNTLCVNVTTDSNKYALCQNVSDMMNREDISCAGKCDTSQTTTSCSCAPSCSLSKSCCHDYESICNTGKDILEIDHFSINVLDGMYLCKGNIYNYTVNHCPSGFLQDRDRCENITGKVGDALIPVVDNTTGIYFQNIHCWRCWNNSGVALPLSAVVRFDKDSFETYIPRNSMKSVMAYMTETPNMVIWESPASTVRHPCKDQLLTLNKQICNQCVNELISPTCASDFLDVPSALVDLLPEKHPCYVCSGQSECRRKPPDKFLNPQSSQSYIYGIQVSEETESENHEIVFQSEFSEIVCDDEVQSCTLSRCDEMGLEVSGECLPVTLYSSLISICGKDENKESSCSPPQNDLFLDFLMLIDDINPIQQHTKIPIGELYRALVQDESESAEEYITSLPNVKELNLPFNLEQKFHTHLNVEETIITSLKMFQHTDTKITSFLVYFASIYESSPKSKIHHLQRMITEEFVRPHHSCQGPEFIVVSIVEEMRSFNASRGRESKPLEANFVERLCHADQRPTNNHTKSLSEAERQHSLSQGFSSLSGSILLTSITLCGAIITGFL